MAVDYYTAGASLTEAVTAAKTALSTLQRLGQSDKADAALTAAEDSAPYAAIAADKTHNDAWKTQRYAQTYTTVMDKLVRQLTSVAATAGKQDASDASSVFGIAGLPGDVASLSIALRDAQDRVADVTDPSQRQTLLASAVRNGDATLARALVQSAVETGDIATAEAFQEAFPNLNDATERLWNTARRKSSTIDVATAMRVAALKPAALASKQDYEIASLASGAE